MLCSLSFCPLFANALHPRRLTDANGLEATFEFVCRSGFSSDISCFFRMPARVAAGADAIAIPPAPSDAPGPGPAPAGAGGAGAGGAVAGGGRGGFAGAEAEGEVIDDYRRPVHERPEMGRVWPARVTFPKDMRDLTRGNWTMYVETIEGDTNCLVLKRQQPPSRFIWCGRQLSTGGERPVTGPTALLEEIRQCLYRVHCLSMK